MFGSPEILALALPIITAFGLFIILKPEVGLTLVAFFTPISPLITVGRTAYRDITIRVDDIVFVFLVLAFLARGSRIKFHELYFDKDAKRIFGLLVAFFLLHVLSYLMNIGSMGSFHTFTLIKYTQYWFYFVLALTFGGYRVLRSVFWAFLIGSTLATIFWLYKIFVQGVVGNAMRFPFHERYGGRENVGIFSLGILSFASAFLFLSSTWIQKIYLSGISLASLIVWTRTLSRASYLGGIAWLLTFLTLVRRYEVLAFAILGVVLFAFFAPDYFIERVKHTFEGLGGGEVLGVLYVESSVFVRLGRWKYFLLEQFPQKPIFGYGPFGLGLMDSQYMRVLAEVGIVGFIVFVLLLVSLFSAFLKIFRETRKDAKAFSLGILCWLSGILLHMIPANTFVLLQTSQIFWLFSGLILSLRKSEKEMFIEKEKGH